MDTKIIIVIGAAVFALFVMGFLFRFILLYQKKSIAFSTEKKLMETKFEQEILLAQLEIQEQTLKNISQEIHDNIGQTLSLVKLNLNTMNPEKVQVLPQKIAASKELVGKAIADLRSLSKSLNTDSILSAGLLKAIQYELSLIEKTGIYTTEFRVIGNALPLQAQKELILFRIVQEAVNNIIKHAKATAITITAYFGNEQLTLVVEDNGCGFEKPAVASDMSEGLGLRSMESRAQLINGNFSIDSKPSNGTKIQIAVAV